MCDYELAIAADLLRVPRRLLQRDLQPQVRAPLQVQDVPHQGHELGPLRRREGHHGQLRQVIVV